MRRSTRVVILLSLALLGLLLAVAAGLRTGKAKPPDVKVAATRQPMTPPPSEDPAKRVAAQLARYLRNARVHSVEVRLNREAEASGVIDDGDRVAAMVQSFVDALRAADLQEGKQRHRPRRNVRIRFVIKEGPDVQLDSVGLDMFYAAKGDNEATAQWINLQTPALTSCFREQLGAV